MRFKGSVNLISSDPIYLVQLKKILTIRFFQVRVWLREIFSYFTKGLRPKQAKNITKKNKQKQLKNFNARMYN